MQTINYDEQLPLFVYGILKSRFNGVNMVDAYDTKYQLAEADGRIYHLGGYPGAKFGGEGVIRGQLITLPENQYHQFIRKTDALEGFNPGRADNHFYDRKIIYVTVSDTEPPIRAWTYEYMGEVSEEHRIWEGEFVG
jgi:gamma-glutamylcyclotransferase (GGCT)/AIG2-like uncharacterized protein YtfP